MATTDDCLFCRILDGEVPSTQVAANDQAYAFRDINPAAPVHVLVIPRRHIPTAAQLGPDDGQVLAKMFGLAQDVARIEAIDESGYRLVFNVGDDALNTIGHLHLHVMGGHRMAWPIGSG